MSTITLSKALAAWGTPEFNALFKQEVEQLDPHDLPLQQGLSLSSYVSNEPISVVILSTEERPETISIKGSVFYSGIIAGCSCSDDPTPNDKQNEQCELLFEIDRQTAQCRVALLVE